MIRAEGVKKFYGKQQVLENINLNVGKGEWICFYGTSGCGKTTLISTLAGVCSPDSGSVALGSERVGFVFQDDRLLDWKTAEENILLALRSYYDNKTAMERAVHWLDAVGLYECRFKKPGEMSGGMKRRLNIARCLSIEPDILFLDEPFAFLDSGNIEKIRGRVSEAVLERGATVFMVTHSLEELNGIDYRLVNLDECTLPLVLDL